MFSLRNKRRLMKISVNLNKYGPFFIIFPLTVMLKFTVHVTAVHLFTCVAKAVTSRRSREWRGRVSLKLNNGTDLRCVRKWVHLKTYLSVFIATTIYSGINLISLQTNLTILQNKSSNLPLGMVEICKFGGKYCTTRKLAEFEWDRSIN